MVEILGGGWYVCSCTVLSQMPQFYMDLHKRTFYNIEQSLIELI